MTTEERAEMAKHIEHRLRQAGGQSLMDDRHDHDLRSAQESDWDSEQRGAI